LAIITMDDPTASPNNEFDLRVDLRLTDNEDAVDSGTPLPKGSILRLQHARAVGDGVMEMQTKRPDDISASSVAAKGAFDRAGDEDITIEFEYLFINDPWNEVTILLK